MSSNHEVTRERQPVVSAQQNAPPEVPRRPRSTLQGSRSAHIGGTRNANHHGHANHPNHHQQNQHHPPQPAVREIHKNAWLKRIVPGDKKGAPFVKKYDKLWVVFCVHDDVEAFLEFYSEPKQGVTHRPNAYVSLNSCLHVSPSIIGQENDEYQFAVTLSTQVIRLVAVNWDQMIEWVESLQGKLREMNILSPKDNLYSKLPETTGRIGSCLPGYISTRDPNSPLPPTPIIPNGSSFATPGPASVLQEGDGHHNSNVSVNNVPNGSSGFSRDAVTVTTPVSLLNENYGLAGTASACYAQTSLRDGSDSGLGSGGSIMSINMSNEPSSGPPRVTIFPISVGSTSISTQENENGGPEPEACPRTRTPSPSVVSVVTGNNNSTILQVGSDENEVLAAFLDNSQSQSLTSHIKPTPSNQSTTSAPTIPIYSQPQPRNNKPTPSGDRDRDIQRLTHNEATTITRQHSAPSRPNSTPSENIYEYLFTPDDAGTTIGSSTSMSTSMSNSGQRNSNANNNSHSTSAKSESAQEQAPPLVPRRNLQRRLSSNTHRSSSLNRLEEQNGSGASSRSANSRIRNQNQNDHQKEWEPMEALIGVKSGEYRIRREEAIPGGHPHHEFESRNPGGSSNPMSHIPLKEQQVIRLRAEMNHPGGVRVVLRKKDCVASIGFVDYLGAVWIAGWKQQQHPVLYYAFHVGDQVLKVAGVSVQNCVEANRAIKMASSLQVEFVIRRLPHGNVFVLKRSREGEPLGLVAINNTPEIGEVLPEGLAASQGLPPSCRGADGLSNCTWFLTEVNNRPLSLLARENEVRDRLNAVGKEISILVQPSDLVKHLKKHLKAMKGFKDYLVV